jgi:hypothetical protein
MRPGETDARQREPGPRSSGLGKRRRESEIGSPLGPREATVQARLRNVDHHERSHDPSVDLGDEKGAVRLLELFEEVGA